MTGAMRGAAVLAMSVLAGCVAPPPPPVFVQQSSAPQTFQSPQQQVPLVAVPGAGKTPGMFNQDDAGCRSEAARAPMPATRAPATDQSGAPGPAPPGIAPPGLAPPGIAPPGIAYLRCMEAHGNAIAPLPTAPPATYGYYAPYPIYAAYSQYGFYGYDPFFGGPFGFGYGFGYNVGF